MRLTSHTLLLTAIIAATAFPSAIAVQDLRTGSGISAADAAMIREEIENRIVTNGKHVLVNRSDLALILNEQRFTLSGLSTDATEQKAASILGADSMIAGSLCAADDQWILLLRLVDVHTGTVVRSCSSRFDIEELSAGNIGSAGYAALFPDSIRTTSTATDPDSDPRRILGIGAVTLLAASIIVVLFGALNSN